MRRKYICDPSFMHVEPCGRMANPNECECGCEPDWTCVAWREYAESLREDDPPTRGRRRRS